MHFTYQALVSGGDLQQGDLLKRTPELVSLLEQVHPYYVSDDYRYFLVLTQSCDLVRRTTRGFAAPYITLCAARPLNIVLDKEAAKYQKSTIARAANVVSDKNKDILREFIKNLMNNNNKEFFYLHEDPQSGISESCCAFLRLAVSLGPEHYDICLNSRVLSLEQTFQSKLGWLVGNLYSRVGTDDWVPKAVPSEAAWSKIAEGTLITRIVFMDEKKIESARKSIDEAEARKLSIADLREQIGRQSVISKKENVLSEVIKVLQSEGFVDARSVNRAVSRLRNNSSISSLLK